MRRHNFIRDARDDCGVCGQGPDDVAHLTPEERVKKKYRAATFRRDGNGTYSILFTRKRITYILTGGSKTEAAAWRKADRELYGVNLP